MTDELVARSDPGSPEQRKIDQAAENVTTIMDAIAALPERVPISKRLAASFGIHVDHEGNMYPPQDETNLELLRAVMDLETRIVALELALEMAGIKLPKA